MDFLSVHGAARLAPRFSGRSVSRRHGGEGLRWKLGRHITGDAFSWSQTASVGVFVLVDRGGDGVRGVLHK